MDNRDTERFLNELAVRVFSGDWRGYRDMVEDGMFNVGDLRSVAHLGDDMHRRALSSLSVRIRATGWDGLKVRVTKCTAFGCDHELVEALSTPMIGTQAAAVPFAEAYLLRHDENGMRVSALLNPTSERFWKSGVPRRGPFTQRGGTAEAVSLTVAAMHQALQDDNLGALLSWVDLPAVCFFAEDTVHSRDAEGIRGMMRRLRDMISMIASHDVELVDMARFGDALIAARFEVRVTLHGGARLDPYHNLYFLRQGRDGWRVTAVASASISALPSAEGASAPQYAALPRAMTLKDD
jgi:hypothetical protein